MKLEMTNKQDQARYDHNNMSNFIPVEDFLH